MLHKLHKLPTLDLSNASKGDFCYTSSQFPGGEQFIRIDPTSVPEEAHDGPSMIFIRIRNGDDVMKLIMATDAMRGLGLDPKGVIIPYFPYGRQDRVVNGGESFSAKVFAGLLNSYFEAVITLDNHSPVTNAVLHNNLELSSSSAIAKWIIQSVTPNTDGGKFDYLNQKIVILAPDAGAIKRAEAVAKKIQEVAPEWNIEAKYATKRRNMLSGAVISVDAPNFYPNEHVFVIDDICDGGRTFIELASEIRAGKHQPISLNLFVTHGIFSKGLNELFGYYDLIATTDSFRSLEEYQKKSDNKRFHVLNLFDTIETQTKTNEAAK